jgi:hypothetical protein
MKTIQRLNDYQSLRAYNFASLDSVNITDTSANSGWYVSSGNGSLIVTGEKFFARSHYVLKINPTNQEPITIRLDFDSITTPFNAEDIGQSFVFTSVLNCNLGNPQVSALICNSNDGCNEANTRDLLGGSWDAIRSNVLTITGLEEGVDLYGITVTISNHSPNFDPDNTEPGHTPLSTMYLSTPNLVNDNAWANNPVIQNMRPYLPGVYESYDSNETDPTWPFFRLVDVLTDSIADSMFKYSDWFQHEKSELPANFSSADVGTRSRLTDYNNVRDENLAWLAQFSGHQIVQQLYDADNTAIITDTEGYKIAQLYPAIYGTGSGTQGSLKAAAQFVLTGDKTVSIDQRYDPGSGASPWNIRIATLGSETPDIDYRGTVKVATVGQITIASAINAGDIIDGIELVNGDKVLVKNQTSPGTEHQNGVYVVSASPSRSPDFDTGWNGTTGEIKQGAVWYVTQGDVNGDMAFEVSTTGNITIGSTAINFSSFSGSPNVLAVVAESKPMGYKIYHTIVDEFTLTLGNGTFGVLGTATL